jgi:hypothetical protein
LREKRQAVHGLTSGVRELGPRHLEHVMKKILSGFLLLLGVAQIIWPFLTAARRTALHAVFSKTFDISKFTEEQLQVYKQFRVVVAQDMNIVLCFGVATILVAVLLCVFDGKNKPDA